MAPRVKKVTTSEQRYVGGDYGAANPDWHRSDSPYKEAQLARVLERNGLVPRRVADLGTGVGEVPYLLAERFPAAAVVAYDVAPEAIAAAREHPRVDYRVGEFPDDGERFDLLLLMDVIEHVVDPVAFLRRAGSYAQHVALHIPLDLSLEWLWKGTPLVEERRSVGHLHHFNRELALEVLRDGGLDVVDWDYTPWGIDLSTPGRRSTRIEKRLRQAAFRARPDLYARAARGVSLLALARTR
jgi:SAM-dependent methyltransferase